MYGILKTQEPFLKMYRKYGILQLYVSGQNSLKEYLAPEKSEGDSFSLRKRGTEGGLNPPAIFLIIVA